MRHVVQACRLFLPTVISSAVRNFTLGHCDNVNGDVTSLLLKCCYFPTFYFWYTIYVIAAPQGRIRYSVANYGGEKREDNCHFKSEIIESFMIKETSTSI